MSIINPELFNKIKKKKTLTYSKEITTTANLSVLGKIKKFLKNIFK
jgi:hypothetical protein